MLTTLCTGSFVLFLFLLFEKVHVHSSLLKQIVKSGSK